MIVRYRVSVLVRVYFSDEFFLFSDFFLYLCKHIAITEDMNITRNIHKSLIYREILPPPSLRM